MAFEDPYEPASRINSAGNLDVTARLEPARHADGSIAEGEPGWTPPRRPLVTVVANLKDDPLGRLFARRQIGQPQFLAGRMYQEHHDAAMITSVRSVDLSKTKVSGGLPAEPLTERQRRAAAKCGRSKGVCSGATATSVSGLFGLCWQSVGRLKPRHGRPVQRRRGRRAACVGYSVSAWTQSRWRPASCPVCAGLIGRTGMREADPADDLARMADEDELADPTLRSGRVN